MFERILNKMRDKIRKREYVMTIHALEEMDDDNLTVFDIEHCFLTGKIVKCQKDQDTAEWKYRLKGNSRIGLKLR